MHGQIKKTLRYHSYITSDLLGIGVLKKHYFHLLLGVVHKLCLKEEVDRWSKKEKKLITEVCERPLTSLGRRGAENDNFSYFFVLYF